MKSFKAVFLLVLLLPVGCGKTDDCGSAPLYVDLTGITGQNVRVSTDNYRNPVLLPDQSSVSYENYALQVIPKVEYNDQRAEALGSWFGTAYACSPALPEPTEVIADIALFSNAAYQQASSDKIIAAGERLNNIVKTYDYRSGRIVGLPDFLLDKPLAAEEGFLLQFTTAPTREATHTLTVRYELDNGETYEFTAPPVTLTP